MVVGERLSLKGMLFGGGRSYGVGGETEKICGSYIDMGKLDRYKLQAGESRLTLAAVLPSVG